MLTSSKKAKGRRLQQYIRDVFRELGKSFGLVDNDCNSIPMGSAGLDIQLSPLANKVFKVNIEAKNVEKLNVTTTFQNFNKKYKNGNMNLLIHSRNNTTPMVTMNLSDFIIIYKCYLGQLHGVVTGLDENSTLQKNI